MQESSCAAAGGESHSYQSQDPRWLRASPRLHLHAPMLLSINASEFFSFLFFYIHLPCTGESEFAGESASSIWRCWAASSPPSTFQAATCPAILLCHHKQVNDVVWSSARTFSVLLGLMPFLAGEQKCSLAMRNCAVDFEHDPDV